MSDGPRQAIDSLARDLADRIKMDNARIAKLELGILEMVETAKAKDALIERMSLAALNDAERFKVLEHELARLKAGGCARDQRTTQYCAEAVTMAKELAELREDKALLDAFDVAGRHDDVVARQISETECETELVGYFWQTPSVQSASCREAIRAAIGTTGPSK